MSDIVERLEMMAHSMRDSKSFQFSKNDQKIIGEMFNRFKECEFLQADFHGIDYSWYGHESNIKRIALIENIKENYNVISTCLNKLYGNIMNIERSINEKGSSVTALSEDIAKEIALTCHTKFQFGVNGDLAKALDYYQFLLTDFLVNCYQTYQLELENEFYQDLLKLSDSSEESN